MGETLKTIILTGSAITTLSVVLALGNFFTIKSSLEKKVNEKIQQLRSELQQPAFSSNAAKLQAPTDNNVENNSPEELGQNDNGEVKQTHSIDDSAQLASAMNKTLSKDVQDLHNMSQNLIEKVDSNQKKIKLLEEMIGRNGVHVQKGMAAKAQPGDDAKKGKEDNGLKVPTKEMKQTKNPQGITQSERHVYFSVALTKTLNNIGANHVIIFDMVYSNEGFGYDINTGKFLVPTTGTYLFMFFVEAINKEGKTAHVNLVVDGKNKATALAEAWHNGQDVTSANAALTHLIKGQKAWIQTAGSSNKANGIDKRKTTFTGVLLFS